MKRRSFLKSLLALGGLTLSGFRPEEDFEPLPVVELSEPNEQITPGADDHPYYCPVPYFSGSFPPPVYHDIRDRKTFLYFYDDKPGWLL